MSVFDHNQIDFQIGTGTKRRASKLKQTNLIRQLITEPSATRNLRSDP